MERSKLFLYNVNELVSYLHNIKCITIYGVGDYGKKLIDYLIFTGRESKIQSVIVTKRKDSEHNYRGIKILKAMDFFETNKHCCVIIAASSEHWGAMEEMVRSQGALYQIMTQELYRDIAKKMDNRECVDYQGIDFMLAGFEKCGTSSLYAALKNVSFIYLPDKEESHYFSWFHTTENARKKLIDTYFDNIRKGQIVGMVEPTFWASAKEIYEEFGGNIKLIFLVRNPVDAVFSYFKMGNRLGQGELLAAYQKCDGKFHVSMFDEYLSWLMEQKPYIFQYDYWIETFLQKYPKEQIKVIFLEELINASQFELREILEFIGIFGEWEFENLPQVNEGNFVMADSEGYKVAGRKFMLCQEWDRLNEEKKLAKEREFFEVQKKYADAKKIYGVKITDRQRKNLCLHFAGSVRKLEKMLERDLSKIWF